VRNRVSAQITNGLKEGKKVVAGSRSGTNPANGNGRRTRRPRL
jgi:hypothetical protein